MKTRRRTKRSSKLSASLYLAYAAHFAGARRTRKSSEAFLVPGTYALHSAGASLAPAGTVSAAAQLCPAPHPIAHNSIHRRSIEHQSVSKSKWPVRGEMCRGHAAASARSALKKISSKRFLLSQTWRRAARGGRCAASKRRAHEKRRAPRARAGRACVRERGRAGRPRRSVKMAAWARSGAGPAC